MVLEEQERKTTLHIVCDQCGGASLVHLTQGQMGIVSLGVMTDLEQSEARRLYLGSPVSPEEVFETHQFLKSYQGDLRDMLQKNSNIL